MQGRSIDTWYRRTKAPVSARASSIRDVLPLYMLRDVVTLLRAAQSRQTDRQTEGFTEGLPSRYFTKIGPSQILLTGLQWLTAPPSCRPPSPPPRRRSRPCLPRHLPRPLSSP